MNYKILYACLFSISLYLTNSKNYFNTDRITRLINKNSNLILYPLKKISGKNIKIIENKDFDTKVLNLCKSKYPYIVLDGLFEGSDGNLISAKSPTCPFYNKNKIPISDFINYKINYSFDKINTIINKQIMNQKSSKINLTDISFTTTAMVIGNVILGIEDYKTIYSLEKSFTRLLHDLSNRPHLYSVLKPFKKIPLSINIQISKDLKNINNIFNEIIKKKDNSMILEMEKHNSYKEICNFLKFFFFSGFETTSNQLTFVMFMLSKNKKWQDEIYEEIKLIKNVNSLEKCKFLSSFIFETLRIHPIVNTSTREDKNSIYIFNVEKINQIEGDNSFNPYRYLNENPEIYTFQNGSRQCIGKRLALVEIKLFVIHFVKLFKIESNNNPKISYSLTKYLSPFLELNISKRKGNNIIIKNNENKKIEDIKVIYKGNNYNLSEYIFKHPGGKFIIKALNNNDITEEFLSKHMDSARANKILEKYKNYEPNKDIFKMYQILGTKSYNIGSDFLLIKITYDKICNYNEIFKNGNTVVFHQIDGYKTRCFSISDIDKQKNNFTLFIKKYPNSLFLDNIKKKDTNFSFSFINSVYSNIKDHDILISVGSGLAPFISFANKCKVIGSFKDNYNKIFKDYNIKNLLLANTNNKYEKIYDIINKEQINYNSNIYLCGNYSFIREIKTKYKFNKIFYDEW